MGITVSIITVYYNTPAELRKLHQSMQHYLPQGCYEWIVADNHSLDDLTAELSCSNYLRLNENFGFAKASNLAAAESSAPFLFFVNPDCEMISDCLTPLLAVMDGASVAGPRVFNTDGTVQLSFGPELSIGAEAKQKMLMRFERNPFVQQWLRRKTSFEPDYVSGCALMISRELFGRIGGFDEEFFLYEEDVDLCKRVRAEGGSIRYVPEARIVHHRNRSTENAGEFARAAYRKSQIYYYEKHHGVIQRKLLHWYISLSPRSRRSLR